MESQGSTLESVPGVRQEGRGGGGEAGCPKWGQERGPASDAWLLWRICSFYNSTNKTCKNIFKATRPDLPQEGMLAGFAPSPVVGFAGGSFACSPSSHALAPRGSATVVGASIPAARRGRARTLLRCSLDPGSAQSSRRQLMTLATAGLLGTLASTAGAEDIMPAQKGGVIAKMKGKVTSKVSPSPFFKNV